jgi:hypothetical protein
MSCTSHVYVAVMTEVSGQPPAWRESLAARSDRALALGALREATVSADAPYASTADRIRAIVALRRAISDVLDAGALTAQEVQAATGCSDYTLVLARDVDYIGDDAVPGATLDDKLLRLQALELMLDDQWRNAEPNPGTRAERPRHPAAPRPVRAWNQLDAATRDAYLDQARIQLAQPPAPNHHPWTFDWRMWHQLLSLGTVVADKDPDTPGYWRLFDPANVALGRQIDKKRDDTLTELSAAGLAVVTRAGDELVEFVWSRNR